MSRQRLTTEVERISIEREMLHFVQRRAPEPN
jgi:hypothetical protein